MLNGNNTEAGTRGDTQTPPSTRRGMARCPVQGNGDGMIDLHELKIWEGGFFFIEDSIDKAKIFQSRGFPLLLEEGEVDAFVVL